MKLSEAIRRGVVRARELKINQIPQRPVTVDRYAEGGPKICGVCAIGDALLGAGLQPELLIELEKLSGNYGYPEPLYAAFKDFFPYVEEDHIGDYSHIIQTWIWRTFDREAYLLGDNESREKVALEIADYLETQGY